MPNRFSPTVRPPPPVLSTTGCAAPRLIPRPHVFRSKVDKTGCRVQSTHPSGPVSSNQPSPTRRL
eukprot:742703-Pyramimonas_sp.AAC.1